MDKSKIRVRLIGNYKVEQLQEVIDSYKLREIVSLMPYMKHRECLTELMKSDALLLIEPSGPGAEAFYTGKVFEYMNTKRPILASIPQHGAAAQLIKATKTGLVSDFNDIETTKKNLIQLYNCWRNGTNSVNPVVEEVKKFERKELTKSLVEVLNNSFKK